MYESFGVTKISPPLEGVLNQNPVRIVSLTESSLELEHLVEQNIVAEGSAQLTLNLGLDPFELHGELTNQGCSLRPHAGDQSKLEELRTQLRKSQHVEICKTQDIEASDRNTGFGAFSFEPRTLPELDFDQLRTSQRLFGRSFTWPLLITGMTGGFREGQELNLRLARAAARYDIPMGVGSQRIALEFPKHAEIFAVKKSVPGIFLIANLGANQIVGPQGPEWAAKAVEMIEADAIAIHLNVLQECIQVEGDRSFRGILKGIERICRQSSVPVIAKEVGAGIDPLSARRLKECGVSALDVGGRGGSSWGYIEGLRSADPVTQELAKSFRDWGMSTARALQKLRLEALGLPLIATGGIRQGTDIAKAIALGADFAGVGLPLLRAALESEEALDHRLKILTRGLSITMMLTGSAELGDLGPALIRTNSL